MSAHSLTVKRLSLILFVALLAAISALTAFRSAAAAEWRVYNDPTLGFRILYPGALKGKKLGREVGGGIYAAHEWAHPDGKIFIRLNIIERPEGMTVLQWIKREYEGSVVEHRVAGQPAFIRESLFEGQLNTEVFVVDPKSGRIVNFTHSVRGVANPEGKPLNVVKNRYRDPIASFWNMVESIKFDDPALKDEPKTGTTGTE